MFSPELVSSDIADLLRVRWAMFRGSGFKGADPLIIQPCLSLNKLRGIVTVFSCEGHLSDTSIDSPYFMLACLSEEGLCNLSLLHKSINEQLGDVWKYRYKTSFTTRQVPVKDSDTLYPAIILSSEITNKKLFNKQKDTFLDALTSAAKSLAERNLNHDQT